MKVQPDKHRLRQVNAFSLVKLFQVLVPHFILSFILFWLDVLSIPSVNIDNVTPFSMRAEWGDVNYPVDSWIVTIRKNIGTVSSENEEANPITKVT